MKKLFISLILALISIADIKAQDVQLATLQKGEDTQIFYGSNAFKEAMAAAEHGNTITLSPGTFNATTINKAVTIYGAGYEIEVDKEKLAAEPAKYPTRINGDFSIALDSIDGQPAKGLYIEGILSTNIISVTKELEYATFLKCDIHRIQFGNSTEMTKSKHCLIKQCKLNQFTPGESESMAICNSFIYGTWENNNASTLLIKNSIIKNLNGFLRATLQNSIIYNVWTGAGYFSYSYGGKPVCVNCSVYNCFFPYKAALDDVITKNGNWIDTNMNTILFDEANASYYQLTEEAKKTYLGTDGTEIGIYGGETPFSPILTIPRITKKEIATKTENGKLKVNIKVEIGDNSL